MVMDKSSSALGGIERLLTLVLLDPENASIYPVSERKAVSEKSNMGGRK